MENYKFQVTMNGKFDGRTQRVCSHVNLLNSLELVCNEVHYDIVCDLDYHGKYKKEYGITEVDLQSANSLGYLAFLFLSEPKKIGVVFKAAGSSQLISSNASDSAINLLVSGKEKEVLNFFKGLLQSGKFSQIVVQADTNDEATTAKFGKDYQVTIQEKGETANSTKGLQDLQCFC